MFQAVLTAATQEPELEDKIEGVIQGVPAHRDHHVVGIADPGVDIDQRVGAGVLQDYLAARPGEFPHNLAGLPLFHGPGAAVLSDQAVL